MGQRNQEPGQQPDPGPDGREEQSEPDHGKREGREFLCAEEGWLYQAVADRRDNQQGDSGNKAGDFNQVKGAGENGHVRNYQRSRAAGLWVHDG